MYIFDFVPFHMWTNSDEQNTICYGDKQKKKEEEAEETEKKPNTIWSANLWWKSFKNKYTSLQFIELNESIVQFLE